MAESSIKVSVIIPVYNADKFLARCLSSIISQTLKNIEIIVVDDGSTDTSRDILKKFADRDNRIVIIRQRNQGVSIARNAGLAIARGEYVGFVDSDDFVDPGYFESLYTTAIEKGADIVTGFVAMENDRRQHFYNYTNKQTVKHSKCSLVGVVWLNIYKNSMIRDNDISFPPELRTAEDNLFNLKASFFANKVVRAGDMAQVYHHVSTEGSLTAQQNNINNLLPLSNAILYTTKTLNSLDNYDKDVYIMRFLDTLNYFNERFKKAGKINIYTRYRLSLVLIHIWGEVKYPRRLLRAAEEMDINVRDILYGRLAKKLFERQLSKPRNKKEGSFLKVIKMRNIKIVIKEVIRFVLPYGVVSLYKQRLAIGAKKTDVDDNKIAIVAAYRDTEYIKLIKQATKDAGYNVSDYPGAARYVWLHWYENGLNSYEDFARKLSMLKSWKEQGKKVIVHIHNKKPHESSVPSLSHALMTVLCDSADHVTIMSNETKGILREIWYYGDDFSRVSKVPHPHYVGVYGDKIQPTSLLKSDTLRILFFGLVRPYKGIERILDATRGLENVQVSIYGKPKDEQYVAELKSLCADRTNVEFRLEYIPDKDIPQVFADHHIVALPYSVESSLNSGAAVLAMSYGRTIVGTNNGTLRDLEDKSLYFGYDYKNETDHVKQLKNVILSIQKKYGGNYNELLKIGNRVQESVEKHNNIEVVSSSIDQMIKKLG